MDKVKIVGDPIVYDGALTLEAVGDAWDHAHSPDGPRFLIVAGCATAAGHDKEASRTVDPR